MDSSSSTNPQYLYDVFINFRGEDTRKTFVSHLYAVLSNAGIKTFLDDNEKLEKGEEIGHEILQAISVSRVSIVVFSKSYTGSSWCLNELDKIMECGRTQGQIVFPVFYDIDPSVVRHQKGEFGKALEVTAKRYVTEEVMERVLDRWKYALIEASSLSGFDRRHFRSDRELLNTIVDAILPNLENSTLSITEFPVGLEFHVKQVVGLIEKQTDNVCIVGIWGMGGSGKTTAAKAVYNEIHRRFDCTSFIGNIREVCEQDTRGHMHLQQQLLSDVLKTKEKIHSIALGTTRIQKVVSGRKALVVLDDVTDIQQIKVLCGNHICFGSGSVLIVTTRDVHILKLLQVGSVYKMEEMNKNECLELFSWHAFKKPTPKEGFSELSRNVVAYCGGLPAALEVIGSYLYDRTREEWTAVLSKLERIPNNKLNEKLRISYDGLKDDMVKRIFLDICCFFIGKDISYVKEILNGCGLCADIGIAVLIDQSLLKVEKNNKLGMHDLIRDMGREIVRESSVKEPGKRSRLWFHEDVHDVLTENTGTETVEALILNMRRTGRVSFSTNVFQDMKKLRLLQLDRVDLTGDFGYLSKQLRWVNWQRATFNFVPNDFDLENLVVFELTHSNVKQVWKKAKLLPNLKILNLSHSKYLKSTPDFSKLPNLEKLIMKRCPSLSEVHSSIGDLKNLLLLNLKDCSSIVNLPRQVYQLRSVKTLIISGCSKIDKLEEDIVQMKSLTTLIAANIGIKQVPLSIFRSKNIGYISLRGYAGLSRDFFPSIILSWISPKKKSFAHIPPFGGISTSLVSLDVDSNNLGLRYQSPIFSSSSKLRCVSVQCQSEIQLKQELRRFLDDLSELEISHASQISDLSLKSILIGMGSCHIVKETLSKNLSQGLPTNDSMASFLPGNNYPFWSTYTCEGPSVYFQVPEDSVCGMKGITLCVIYSSTLGNMATECLTSVLIINYTQLTIQIYQRDTIISFNDEDWKGVVSKLRVGDDVEIIVAFAHGLTVKETAVYLIYDQSNAVEVDDDAKSKGDPSRCDNQRDMDKASKTHGEILNQSEDAGEKGALVNDVDINIRMAEQIPYAVAESLFNRLASASFRDYGRIYGVMNELERLKNSVECIRAVLPDADKKQEHDCVVQDWITSLKDVLHLADDLFDEFIIDGMRYKVDACDKNQVTWVHSSSSSQIEKIQQKFDDVLEEMAKLKLSPKTVVVKQTYSLRSKSNSFLLEYDITGREDDKKKIINLLKQPHGKRGELSHTLPIAIGGIRGIGKTTLAQFVYNDVEVQNHFEKRMWVCVSNHLDVKTIVKKMLESLVDSKIDAKFSFEYIQHKLRENLTGERYLLVLDDICNDSHVNWTQLRTYLMCGSKDSKVLMTTRKIVSKIPEESKSYVLNGLTLDVSWSMLKKIIFGKEISGVSPKLESIGKKIADKCKGVPLAIRTLGGLLQSKSEEREWINVLQGDFWKLYDDKENMSILKLGYQNLSHWLKQCFAYCSLYPKGWEIKKDLLIQLWMAQGYLDCADEKTLMEDVGNEFVKIFLMKSFFQDAKVGEDGDIVSFKMHDLMHDLATQVAGNDCCYLDRQTEIRVKRPIHVSLEPSAVHLLDSLDASRLRTLILLSSNEGEELNGDELSVLSKFKHLRVLKLSYCSLSKLSSSIEELNHLRYLSLSHCRGLESLDKSISSLVLLQTLILTPEEKFELSTEVVSKLINLRHLHISNWEASREETPSEFVKLSNLKYEGMVFSNWFSPLTNIVEISFFLCGNLQYLPPLEHLPFLKSLHISFLEELEFMCYEQENTSAFFPSLESLSLQFCYKFRGWRRMGDDFNDSNCSQKLSLSPFSRLSQLSIIGCQMLTCMPAFPNLKNRLELYNSCVESLVATLNTVALESLNRSPPLSMLKSLHIDGVSLDVKRIPKDWMQNLTSLQLLQINGFSCQAFQEIETWFKDDHKCPSSLQTIAFHNCEDLEALPEWICNLSSLQHLRVYDCINLTSLPLLTSLQTLEIIGCPFLDEECRHKQMKLGRKFVTSQR